VWFGGDTGVTASLPDGFRLLYESDFKAPTAREDYVCSDPGAWGISSDRSSLELVAQSAYTPAVRSPVNVALIADRAFGDFVLEAEVMQTSREYGHRDLCFYFGFQNPTNFYYAHLASAADDHAHNVFLVRNAPRVKVAREVTAGVAWGMGAWHRVRIERVMADGAIRVFFDDMTKPIMSAVDRTFGFGHVGFGSFDDTGRFRAIRIWGPSEEKRRVPPFPR
jgi:hypothetical protein